MVRLHRPTLSCPTVPLAAYSHGNDRPPNGAASLSFSHPLAASPSATYIRTHPTFPSLSLSSMRRSPHLLPLTRCFCLSLPQHPTRKYSIYRRNSLLIFLLALFLPSLHRAFEFLLRAYNF